MWTRARRRFRSSFCTGAGTLRRAGRVDSGDTCLDHDVIERSRGITVFADEAAFTACGLPFRLIDTPGHADFSGEMERSIWAVDCAVLVVSCVEGVQAHTETVWRLLRQNDVPVVFFLNKADLPTADAAGTLAAVRARLGADVLACGPGFLRGGHWRGLGGGAGRAGRNADGGLSCPRL